MRTHPLALAVLCFTVACGTWVDAEDYGDEIFSDDGVGMAALYREYEAKVGPMTTRRRNQSVQVLMKQNLNTSMPGALTELLPGGARDFYFMRTEGYVLLGRSLEPIDLGDDHEEREIIYEQIALDGTMTSLGGGIYATVSACGDDGWPFFPGSLRFIPSPDGTVLAKVENTISCTERTETVTFLDASDLHVRAGPFVVSDSPLPTADREARSQLLTWTVEDAFAVGHAAPIEEPEEDPEAPIAVELFRLDEAPQTGVALVEACFYPPTTSAGFNADGENIQIDDGAVRVYPAESTDLIFGCERSF